MAKFRKLGGNQAELRKFIRPPSVQNYVDTFSSSMLFAAPSVIELSDSFISPKMVFIMVVPIIFIEIPAK